MEGGRLEGWKIGSPPGHGGYPSFYQDLEGARSLGAAPGDGGFDKAPLVPEPNSHQCEFEGEDDF
jgi:hypothetical protein